MIWNHLRIIDELTSAHHYFGQFLVRLVGFSFCWLKQWFLKPVSKFWDLKNLSTFQIFLFEYNFWKNSSYYKDGEVLEWYVQRPYDKVDERATYHDICYDMGKNKGDCDRVMVKSLHMIPYGDMPKWGQTARFLIDKKQKLRLGVSKNWKSHRVEKTGNSK